MHLKDLSFEQNYLNLEPEFYDFTTPTPLEKPYLISFNEEVA